MREGDLDVEEVGIPDECTHLVEDLRPLPVEPEDEAAIHPDAMLMDVLQRLPVAGKVL